jgi:hypothetical protein
VVLVILITCVVIGFLLMTNRAGRRTYQNYVALDGKGPSLLMNQHSEASDDVVLYRSGRNGVICYDAFHSAELHDFLFPKNEHSVTVEYDTFSYFGKVRAYNVHSVDGKVLANGYHVLREDFAGVAGVAGEGPGSAGEDDCW